MCFDPDSHPPIPPIDGGAVDIQELVIRSGDGGRFAVLMARAEQPSGAGIIVLPDIRGLHPDYEELALRFAEAGIDALALDYFGRTAGGDTCVYGGGGDEGQSSNAAVGPVQPTSHDSAIGWEGGTQHG